MAKNSTDNRANNKAQAESCTQKAEVLSLIFWSRHICDVSGRNSVTGASYSGD